MENFTKNPWRINKIDAPSKPEEKEGHILKIGGTTAREGATITCENDPAHKYPNGTYEAGPLETITAGSYKITFHPGDLHNEIRYTNSDGTAGSWTADDSSSPAGGE